MDKTNRPVTSITELIGNTPMLRLDSYGRAAAVQANLFAKLESFNPGGSVKDRVALNMVNRAEEEGSLRPGSVIVEPTSGNTGIGLALVGRCHGYRVILTMPETMSIERRKLLAAYGAEIVLTPGKEGMKGAIDEAKRICEVTTGAVILGQFVNPANPEAHYLTTGPEIWDALEGKVDCFVSGIGTGGTVSGVGRYLKDCKPEVQIIGVEPSDSAVISGGKPGPHKIQGIGAGFVPDTLDVEVLDRVVAVKWEDAYSVTRLLAATEGFLAGISSGAALFAATLIAKEEGMRGKNIVVLLPDTGERYLSTDLFDR